jgi:hypothetical protein
VIQEIADRPLEHLEQASHLVHQLREVLVDGPVDGSDPDAEGRRRRALDFVLQVTRTVARAFQDGVEAGCAAENRTQAPVRNDEQLKAMAHLLDSVGWNLYFVSGAYEDEEKGVPDPAVQARLLQEAGPILDELADVGLGSLTHHLLETLEALIPSDPRGVFMRIAAVIRGGQKGHYQYDQMAEKVLVRVVERYLADYRPIFQEDEDSRRALIEILDTFVRAGSEGARRLSYRLEGIFR